MAPGLIKCHCPDGQYLDPVNERKCLPCHKHCEDCNGPDELSCKTCPDDRKLVRTSGGAKCVCKEQFNETKDESDTTGNYTKCLPKGVFPDCKFNEWYDTGATPKVCKKCHDKCLTCKDGAEDSCQLCRPGSHRDKKSTNTDDKHEDFGACLDDEGWYYHDTDNEWKECKATCKRCTKANAATECDNSAPEEECFFE
jgi:proprotein convertase subtilisin/kexin type 5